MGQISLSGNIFNIVLDTEFGQSDVVFLPEWINDPTPNVETGLWYRTPFVVTYVLRLSHAQKWIIDQLLTGHVSFTLIDNEYGINGTFWLEEIEEEWRGEEDHSFPWLATITLVQVQ